MSLLDTASLILTPNGYKGGVTTGKLYSVKPTDASGDMVVTRNTTSTRVNSSGLIESVAFNAPRLDYTNASCPSILVEPARTNLVTYSNNFTDASWTKSLATLTPNFGISPDGTQNSTKIDFQINAQLYKLIGTTSNAVSSIYIKGVNGETIQFFNNQTNAYITRTLNGTWQRFVDIAIGTTFSYVGIGTLGGVTARVVEVYGAQLEAGANATSYIPTVAGTVSRIDDIITKTGITTLIGQSEGTIFWDVKDLVGSVATGNPEFMIRNTAFTNWIGITTSTSASPFRVTARAIGLGNIIDYTSNITSAKACLKYGTFGAKLFLNGNPTPVATTAVNPNFSFDNILFSGARISFKTNRFALWTTALTDAQCKDLTT